MKHFLKVKIVIALVIVFLTSGCIPMQSSNPLPQNSPSPNIQNSQTNFEVGNIDPKDDYLAAQAKIDKSLLTELKRGYKFSNPFVALNPYGNSPLSALVIFNTDMKTSVKMTVLGHDSSVNISNTFPSNKQHILPIYGLYAGEKNKIEFVLDNGLKRTITIKTDPLKSILSKAKVLKKVAGAFAYGLTFCDPSTSTPENIYSMAYDSNGDIRWYLKEKGTSMPTQRLKNGRILTTTPNLLDGNYYSVGAREMDLIGKVYKEYVVPGGQHHDLYEMPNGNLIICSNETNFSTREDIAYELDRTTGKIIKTFDMKKIFNQNDGNSFNQNQKDWFHMNAVSFNQKTNTLMFSGRNIDAVVGIDYKTNTLKWVLGDPEGWSSVDKGKFFKPIGSNFEWQYAQHAVKFLPNGDILLFDNGSYRAKKTNPSEKLSLLQNYSRGVQYSINTDTMTVRQIWQFGKERGFDWYSSFISDADYVGANHYIITSGALPTQSKISLQSKTPGVKRNADVVEVKDNKVVFELLVNSLLYRSDRMPFYTSKNTYDINAKGVYVGNFGSLSSVLGVDFNKNSNTTLDFQLSVQKEFGRVVISGVWNSPTRPSGAYVVIYDQSTGKSFAKAITSIPGGVPNQKYYTMISSLGLSGKYKLFIVAGGITYTSKYVITF